MEEEEGRKTEGNGVDERVRRWKGGREKDRREWSGRTGEEVEGEEEGRKTEGNGVDERVRRWKRRKGERQKGMEWTKG